LRNGDYNDTNNIRFRRWLIWQEAYRNETEVVEADELTEAEVVVAPQDEQVEVGGRA